MNKPLTFTICGSLVFLSFGLYRLLDAGRELTLAQKGAASEAIGREGDATRLWLSEQAIPILHDIARDADRQVTEFRKDAKAELDQTRQAVLSIAADAQADVGAAFQKVDVLQQTVGGVRSDLAPTLDRINGMIAAGGATLEDLDRTVKDLHPQFLGLVAAAKVTAGQAAQTMRAVEQATPEMLKTVQGVGDEIKRAAEKSAETSENAAKITKNLAEATKPLPRAVRVGLQVAGPLAQVALYVVLLLQTIGFL